MVEVGWVARAKPGEVACGDHVAVVSHGEHTLVAVIDGLGHGEQAAEAAQAAADFVTHQRSLALSELFKRCDKALTRTRGVAMTVVRIHRQSLTMTHAGIGNVELTAASREPTKPFPRPGVVGGRFRRVLETSYQLAPGDTIALFSDGVSSRLSLSDYAGMDAQQLAEAILTGHAKGHDDACCAVVRC